MVLPLPVEVPAGIVYRPKQVVFHLPDAAQPLLRPIQFQEDFLDDVFGICPVAHPQVGEAEQAVLLPGDERLEFLQSVLFGFFLHRIWGCIRL